jgi:hypothetical protein
MRMMVFFLVFLWLPQGDKHTHTNTHTRRDSDAGGRGEQVRWDKREREKK